MHAVVVVAQPVESCCAEHAGEADGDGEREDRDQRKDEEQVDRSGPAGVDRAASAMLALLAS